MNSSNDRKFPDDHVIETLRGSRVPNSGRVLQTFADRAAVLVRKIEGYQDRARDPKASYLMAELAAIAVAIELVEKKRGENIAASDRLHAARAENEALRQQIELHQKNEASWNKEAERHERDHRDHYEERERLRAEFAERKP